MMTDEHIQRISERIDGLEGDHTFYPLVRTFNKLVDLPNDHKGWLHLVRLITNAEQAKRLADSPDLLKAKLKARIEAFKGTWRYESLSKIFALCETVEDWTRLTEIVFNREHDKLEEQYPELETPIVKNDLPNGGIKHFE